MRAPYTAGLCQLRRTTMGYDRCKDRKAVALFLRRKTKKHGYCEGCKTMQPAPADRKKGWRCEGCV